MAILILFTSFHTILEPISASAASFDDYFTSSSKYEDPIKAKARKELSDLKNLQDSRLDLCADKGKNWEQCFMFGESPTVQKGKERAFSIIPKTKGDNASSGENRVK